MKMKKIALAFVIVLGFALPSSAQQAVKPTLMWTLLPNEVIRFSAVSPNVTGGSKIPITAVQYSPLLASR